MFSYLLGSIFKRDESKLLLDYFGFVRLLTKDSKNIKINLILLNNPIY